MPSISTTARQTVALVGTDSQAWGGSAVSIDVGRDSIGPSGGILAARGTITIQEDTTNPESVRPLDNPQRWHKGQSISLQVANDSGTQVNHPLGKLFVTAIPSFNYSTRVLTLEVGDVLAFYDSPTTSGDASGITLCNQTTQDLATTATNYLIDAGIPPSNIALGTFGVTHGHPIDRGGSSSVARAGELAYCAGYQLYVDSLGIVRAKRLVLSPGVADLTVTIGQNEVEYTLDPELVEPFETVQVVGTGRSAQTIENPIITTSSDSSIETYNLQEFDLTITQLLGPLGNSVTVPEGEYIRLKKQSRLRQREDEIVNGSTSGVKITVHDSNEFRYYRRTDACKYRLHYIFRYNDAAPITYLSEGGSLPVRIEETTENFTYSDDDELLKHAIVDYAREDLYDPDNGISIPRRTVRRATRRWTKRGEDLWEFEDTEVQAAIRVRTDAEFTNESDKWNLIPSKEPVSEPATTPGRNTPPQSEYWTPYYESQTVFEGSAPYTQRGAATGLNRKRPAVRLPDGLAFTQAQVDARADEEVKLLDGRTRQHTISIPCSNALLAIDEPFPRVDVVEGDRTRQYIFDAVSWTHTNNSLVIEGLGIEIADSAFPTVSLRMIAPSPTFSANAVQSLLAELIITAPSPTFSAVAEEVFNAELNVIAPSPIFSAVADVRIAAELNVVAPSPIFSAQADVPVSAQLNIIVPSPTFRAGNVPIPWTPADISTQVWLDSADAATLFTTTAGGTTVAPDGSVARIEDKSGNNRYAQQGTISLQPVRKTSIYNGLDVVRYETLDQRMLLNSFTEGSLRDLPTFEVICVIQTITLGSTAGAIWTYPAPWSGAADWLGHHLDATDVAAYWFDSSSKIATQPYTAGILQIQSYRRDSGLIYAGVNGVRGAGVSVGALGSSGSNIQLGENLAYDLCEFIVVSSLTDVERIEGYMAHRWGIEASLPSGHPYRNSPPLN